MSDVLSCLSKRRGSFIKNGSSASAFLATNMRLSATASRKDGRSGDSTVLLKSIALHCQAASTEKSNTSISLRSSPEKLGKRQSTISVTRRAEHAVSLNTGTSFGRALGQTAARTQLFGIHRRT